jgi:ankyrin repeat protein
LHIAVITNQFDIVRYLVEESSAWLDIHDRFHQTAIHYALRLNDLTTANYLLSKKDNNHIPPNISQDQSKLLQIIVENNFAKKKDSKENEEISTSMDESLLPILFCMIAAEQDTQIMNSFLKQYPNLNALDSVDYDFRSAAHVAAVEGKIETIRFLSQQCTNQQFQNIINREDRWGLSPLDEAYRNGHTHITQFINENKKNQSNEIDTNISKPKEIQIVDNIIVQLLRKWRKIFLFCTLSASGAAERIDALLSREYFIPTELYADYHGRNPMHFAGANGHLNVIQVLIKHGYQGATYRDRWGNYPADHARLNKFDNIVNELTRLKL